MKSNIFLMNKRLMLNEKQLKQDNKSESMSNINGACEILDLIRGDLLKGWQDSMIFMTWVQQRNQNLSSADNYFLLYQKIFHCRRIFRLFSSIVYLPQIIQEAKNMQIEVTFKGVFSLLGNLFTSLFMLFDNITIVMMLVKNSSYRTVRRISYTILLCGIVSHIFSMTIKLRESFAEEANLKKQLEEITPTQFLQKINQIDDSRKFIALEFIQTVGNFFPTVARTNLPELIVRTKVNKGTVGFFGVISSLASIILKLKRNKKQFISQ